MALTKSIMGCLESMWNQHGPLALKSTIVISTIVVSFVAYRKYKRHTKWKSFPKDVVILHQFPGKGLRAPSVNSKRYKLSYLSLSTNRPI